MQHHILKNMTDREKIDIRDALDVFIIHFRKFILYQLEEKHGNLWEPIFRDSLYNRQDNSKQINWVKTVKKFGVDAAKEKIDFPHLERFVNKNKEIFKPFFQFNINQIPSWINQIVNVRNNISHTNYHAIRPDDLDLTWIFIQRIAEGIDDQELLIKLISIKARGNRKSDEITEELEANQIESKEKSSSNKNPQNRYRELHDVKGEIKNLKKYFDKFRISLSQELNQIKAEGISIEKDENNLKKINTNIENEKYDEAAKILSNYIIRNIETMRYLRAMTILKAFQLSLLYHSQKKFSEAINASKIILRHKSDFIPAQIILADCYVRIQNYSKADEILDLIIKREPFYKYAWDTKNFIKLCRGSIAYPEGPFDPNRKVTTYQIVKKYVPAAKDFFKKINMGDWFW